MVAAFTMHYKKQIKSRLEFARAPENRQQANASRHYNNFVLIFGFL